MRNVLLTTTCLTLLLAGCSKSEPDAPYRAREASANNALNPNAPMADVAPEAAIIPPTNTAPGVNVTAAPGVAFNYAYAFRLPAQNIKDAQEAHAQACEKLGVQHCRITGMVYRVTGENSIEGSIQFKLDPILARAFGKAGIDAVTKADGKLVEAEITGTDAGAAIKSLDVQRQQTQAELQRIDGELARTDLKSAERSELQSQRAVLTGQLQQVKSDTSGQEESLANTPVSFSYQSGVAVRGFDGSAPVTSAGNVFLDSAQVTLGFVLTLLAAITPPGLIVLIIFLLWRRFRPRRPAAMPEA